MFGVSRNTLVGIAAVVALFGASGASADWLADQARNDGSYATASDLATPLQSTAEAARTLRILNRGGEAAPAENYVAAEAHRGTEYLARRLIAKADAGIVDPGLVVELQSHQNSDGGE